MDYKELVNHLKEWNENLIFELCADGVLTCDDLCGCTGYCIVIQAAAAITDLLARAEAAEARAEKAEKYIEEVNTAILLKSKTEALNAIKRWRSEKEE